MQPPIRPTAGADCPRPAPPPLAAEAAEGETLVRVRAPSPAGGGASGWGQAADPPPRRLARLNRERADRGAASGLRLVHVLGNQRRVFVVARRHGAHDIGLREVAGIL